MSKIHWQMVQEDGPAALDLRADREGLSVTAFIRQLVINSVLVVPGESRTPVKSGHEES